MSEETRPHSIQRSIRSEIKSLENAQPHRLSLLLLFSSIAIGAANALIVFFAHKLKEDDFSTFAGYVVHVMDIQENQFKKLVEVSYVAGCLSFVLCTILYLVTVFNIKRLMTFCLGLVLLGAVSNVAGGAIILSTISGLDSTVTDTSDFENSTTRQLLDFSVAMYDQCCRVAGLVHSDAAITRLGIAIDDERWDNLETCETFYTAAYYNKLSTMEKLLDTCVGSYGHVQWFDLAVTDFICGTINSTVVDISGLSIGSFSIEQLTEPTTKIPIVGDASEPTFGCGGGKISAFQFVMYAWILTSCRPVAIAMISTGSISIFLCLVGFGSLCLGPTDGDQSMSLDFWNAYMTKDHSSQGNSSSADDFQTRMHSFDRSSARLPPGDSFVVVSPVRDIDDKI